MNDPDAGCEYVLTIVITLANLGMNTVSLRLPKSTPVTRFDENIWEYVRSWNARIGNPQITSWYVASVELDCGGWSNS